MLLHLTPVFLITISSPWTQWSKAYINNFIQIWCGAPFYGMPYGSNSCQMYLEPHGPPFESSSRKNIWIILLRSNTDDSRRGFHMADCDLRQYPAPTCHKIWIYIHSVPVGGLRHTILGNHNHLKTSLRLYDHKKKSIVSKMITKIINDHVISSSFFKILKI